MSDSDDGEDQFVNRLPEYQRFVPKLTTMAAAMALHASGEYGMLVRLYL